jgi:polyferredoxin
VRDAPAAAAWWKDLHSREWSAVLPALSPYLGICSAVTLRAVPIFLLLGLPVLILALVRGRWFCRQACPVGLLTE